MQALAATDLPSLQTVIGQTVWPTPVALASGTCGFGEELDGILDWRYVGAIFTKGLSLKPRAGHPPPRIYETKSGMLNAIGIENVGFAGFVRDKLPFLRKFRSLHGGKVFVNLYGTSIAEYQELTERLTELPEVDGLEINLSCPNVQAGGLEFGRDPQSCLAVTRAVRKATKKCVVVKLSPAAPIIREMALACVEAGADALSIANTVPAMAIDIHKRSSRLSAQVGGLSGPAIKPICVRLVYELAKHKIPLPIIGIGGIAVADDALEYILAGATAVQVGTATFSEPEAAAQIAQGLQAYLRRYQEPDISTIVGALFK